ncbi:unnamed protein product [Fusarium graminearum]|uniref:Secreted protein n=1 Tax=Gibberella zeae TaxID=5518 RepID=A0A9N8NF57_GIBZA|nr:unnamed protein product [Fusarium graminearum]
MKTSLSILLCGAIVAVSASALPKDNPLEGYKIVPLKWTGVLEDGAEPVTLTGSIDEISAQIQKLNPNYMPPETNSTAAELEKRSQGHIICNVGGWGAVDTRAAQRDKDWLRSIGGQCHVGPGPRTCTRVSGNCRTADAIMLCNDNNHAIAPSCGYLGDYVDHITSACAWEVNSPPCWVKPCGPKWTQYLVRGQQFDSDGYNVIVAKVSC